MFLQGAPIFGGMTTLSEQNPPKTPTATGPAYTLREHFMRNAADPAEASGARMQPPEDKGFIAGLIKGNLMVDISP